MRQTLHPIAERWYGEDLSAPKKFAKVRKISLLDGIETREVGQYGGCGKPLRESPLAEETWQVLGKQIEFRWDEMKFRTCCE